MDAIIIITQTVASFIGGVIVGGTLQHRYRWLDRLINILS